MKERKISAKLGKKGGKPLHSITGENLFSQFQLRKRNFLRASEGETKNVPDDPSLPPGTVESCWSQGVCDFTGPIS